MKLYLSSYKLGNREDLLKDWIKTSGNNKIALIPNAGDSYNLSPQAIAEKRQSHSKLLTDVGFNVSIFDLKKYFGKEKQLIKDLANYKAFWVVGGNTYVLRQAMRLSGFDRYLISLRYEDGFLYGGWSAGICVLAKSLVGLDTVDDPKANPYNTEVIWEGIGLLDYLPLPHYKSDHPESAAVDKEVERAIEKGIPHKTLRDGEVIYIDTVTGKEQNLRS